ncbi:MAG: ROK family transcriptional regulator [Clostridia bacterium]|nr:ROK family transcriptional regulator [Clostridia bacterium]
MKSKKGSFSLMKRMNINLIINLIRKSGSISRIDIAKKTGLTAATVTNLTSELLEFGIIKEYSMGASTGGRKPVLLKMNSKRFYLASAYISPMNVEVAVSDCGAEFVFYRHEKPFSDEFTPENCIDFIAKSLEKFVSQSGCTIAGLGVGLHGIVNSEEGIIVNAPNLGWKNVAIKRIIEEKTKLPVYVDNDVRLMAMAETWFGADQNIGDFAFLYVGRGVGGAVLSSGELMRGKRESAAEIGHTVIDMNGPLCECGKRGCLQAHVSESAMQKRLEKYSVTESVLNHESDCNAIVDAYLNNGDELAKKIIDDEIRFLSVGVSNLISTFDPCCVVISSSIKNFDIAVMEKLSQTVNENDIGRLENNCVVRYSTVGERAVLKGAVAAVLSEIYNNPAEFNAT